MAYDRTFSLALGSSKTGLTLRAQLKDATGTNVGGVVTTGFVEIGGGNYTWTGTIPDDLAGSAVFSDDDTDDVLAAAAVNPATATDKTGYKLAADGLDAISTADPGGVANHTTLAKMVVALWRTAWKKNTLTAGEWKRYADNGTTVNATAALSDNGTTQTQGHFS